MYRPSSILIAGLTLILLASACAPGTVDLPTTVVTPTAWETPTPWDCGWPYCGPMPSDTPTPSHMTAASATPTETPAGVDTPCAIVIRTPPPSAPTSSSFGTSEPRQVDPHVEVCASATALKVGDTVAVVGRAVDIGLPYFQINVKDADATEFTQWVEVTYENQIRRQTDASRALELVSVTGDMTQVMAVLRARAAGGAEIVIGATGEVHYGYPGPATWAGGGSESLLITVVNP